MFGIGTIGKGHKCTSAGVGLLGKNIRSKMLLTIEGAVWVELQVAEGNNTIVGVVMLIQKE